MKSYKSFAWDVSPQTGSTWCWLKTKKKWWLTAADTYLAHCGIYVASSVMKYQRDKKKSTVCSSSSGILTSRHMTEITTNLGRVTSWPSLWPNIHLSLPSVWHLGNKCLQQPCSLFTHLCAVVCVDSRTFLLALLNLTADLKQLLKSQRADVQHCLQKQKSGTDERPDVVTSTDRLYLIPFRHFPDKSCCSARWCRTGPSLCCCCIRCNNAHTDTHTHECMFNVQNAS